ncbi:MAG: tyrosine--tRNA ligase [Desulfobacteraceae bacterium]
MNVLDVLQERGFVEDLTHEEELREYLDEEKKSCYIGFDPTAASLHVGSLVPIMSLAHMQKNGHCPIALVGGGTGLIGDPSGKTEMRKVISQEEIDENKNGIKKQLARFIQFKEGGAKLLDNGEWLNQLAYIPFLRDIGRHFSVNRMIKAESYKMRLEAEEGLSFIEFNYMILQAYDFMKLGQTHGCLLQMGGSDQWGNIVAGIDLVRRTLGKSAFGITFPLITTSSGIKMGKTHKGAVWLDPERTSPYEYYQFWVNTEDADVEKFLALFTFLPMDEIRSVKNFHGAQLNSAKAVLAFEATRIAHGLKEAEKAFTASAEVFGRPELSEALFPSSSIPRKKEKGSQNSSIPTTALEASTFEQGIKAVDLFVQTGLFKSKGEARRLLNQGGGYVNGNRISAFDENVSLDSVENDGLLLRAGKKRYHKIILKKAK